jgi:hypothetical protein
MTTPDVRTALGELIALPWRLTRSALLVPGLVNQASRIMEDIVRIVAAAEELLALVSGTLSLVQQTAEAAAILPRRVARMLEQSEQLPHLAGLAIERATGVFDGASTLIGQIDGMPARLRPLIDAFASLDPGVAAQLGHLIPSVGPLMSRIEDEVIPSVASLEGLAPAVETLHLNVGELESMLNDFGKLLALLPGASSLLQRRRVDPGDSSRVPPEPPVRVPPEPPVQVPPPPAPRPRAVKAAPRAVKAAPRAVKAMPRPIKATADPDSGAGSGRPRRAPER